MLHPEDIFAENNSQTPHTFCNSDGFIVAVKLARTAFDTSLVVCNRRLVVQHLKDSMRTDFHTHSTTDTGVLINLQHHNTSFATNAARLTR